MFIYLYISSTRLKRKRNLSMPVTGTAWLSCDTGMVYSTSCLLIVYGVLLICFAYTKQVLPFKMQQWVQLWHWLVGLGRWSPEHTLISIPDKLVL